MKFSLSKQQKVIIISLVLLMIFSEISFYFWILKPEYEKEKQIRLTLRTEEKLNEQYLQSLQQKTAVKTSHQLQKKLPVLPLLEQVFLTLEKAEIVSNSVIESYKLREEDDASGSESGETTEIDLSETNQQDDGQTASDKEKNDALPDHLKSVTIDLTVNTTSYENLLTFLATIEKNERITTIDQISVQQPEEDETDVITYQVTLSAYYAEGFQELEGEAPKAAVPEAGGSNNPLGR